MVVLTFYHNR